MSSLYDSPTSNSSISGAGITPHRLSCSVPQDCPPPSDNSHKAPATHASEQLPINRDFGRPPRRFGNLLEWLTVLQRERWQRQGVGTGTGLSCLLLVCPLPSTSCFYTHPAVEGILWLHLCVNHWPLVIKINLPLRTRTKPKYLHHVLSPEGLPWFPTPPLLPSHLFICSRAHTPRFLFEQLFISLKIYPQISSPLPACPDQPSL